MSDNAWGMLAVIVFFVGMFIYVVLDRWCDHQEEMRKRK